MKRALFVSPVLATVAALALTTASAVAANLCVGPNPPCYATLAAAVKAAHRGDTIQLGPGTFTGGVTIPVSINLLGAGSGRTSIEGGGPVLTIGGQSSDRQPTVSITRVTITGGRTKGDGTKAKGGGIWIPPGGGGNGLGATVTISDSIIAGNSAEPTVAAPLGPPCPGGKSCPYAGAYGGGIDNSGTLTLDKTTIRDNQVGGPVASDAEGAGISSHAGRVTLINCLVTGNRAAAIAPNGRFADGGGIFVEGGTLTVRRSTITDNLARLSAAFPRSVELGAVGGGIHVTDQAKGSFTDSTISGNSAVMTNTVGDATAFSGGVHSDGPLVLTKDTIDRNTATASTLGASHGNASADSGAGEINGPATLTRDTFDGNTVRASAPHGLAAASAGAFISAGNPPTTMTHTSVSHNTITATSTTGSVRAQGGGIVNIGGLGVNDSTLTHNTASASGPTGIVQGGAIWNSHPADGPPNAHLTLSGSTITNNTVKPGRGVTGSGGGIYTTTHLTQHRTRVANNTPNDCSGC